MQGKTAWACRCSAWQAEDGFQSTAGAVLKVQFTTVEARYIARDRQTKADTTGLAAA